jgi:3-dehydroquinate synthase
MFIDNIELPVADNLTIHSAYKVYNVVFGPTDISSILEPNDFLFIDENVDRTDFAKKKIFRATEENKHLYSSIELMDEMIRTGFQKGGKLVVVGGGVTQDVGSLCAALFKRGIPWIFFPTTLLSMCDSCIGSKNGVNHGGAKNQVGVFYPPSCVYIDTRFLDTLNRDDINSGFGEILKLYQIGGLKFEPSEQLQTMISKSLLVKKSVIEYDEFEITIRKCLNYGHTFGHVLEVISDYTIPHGTAVIWGMLVVNDYFGVKDEEFEAHCKKYIRPFRFEISNEQFMSVLLKDKKVTGGFISLVRTEFGHTSFVEVPVGLELVEKITSSLLKIRDQLL